LGIKFRPGNPPTGHTRRARAEDPAPDPDGDPVQARAPRGRGAGRPLAAPGSPRAPPVRSRFSRSGSPKHWQQPMGNTGMQVSRKQTTTTRTFSRPTPRAGSPRLVSSHAATAAGCCKLLQPLRLPYPLTCPLEFLPAGVADSQIGAASIARLISISSFRSDRSLAGDSAESRYCEC
jgi:hypothetical protein